MKTSNKLQKLTDKEHVLKRSDTYIGSNKFVILNDYAIFKDFNNEIEYINLYSAPGFIHIFLELISNSVDAIIRSHNNNFPLPQKKPLVEVSYNSSKDTLTIKNYGQPLTVKPFVKGDPNSKLTPELAFGELKTSTNYDDTETRLGVGRNGIGAKATNIFSSSFEVEINDVPSGQLYKGKWKNNMELVESFSTPGFDEKIKKKLPPKSQYSESYVKVTYKPDYKAFSYDKEKVTSINDNLLNTFKRILFDISFSTKIPIIYENKSIKEKILFSFKSLDNFIPYYFPELKERKDDIEKEFPIIHFFSDLKEEDSHIITKKSSDFLFENKTKPSLIKFKDISSSKNSLNPSVEIFITRNYSYDKPIISFVNGLKIETGVHIQEIVDKTFLPLIMKSLPQSIFKKADKFNVKLKRSEIRNYFTFIVNMFLPNPTFSGQTKSNLSSPSFKIDSKLITEGDKLSKILKTKSWKDILSDIESTLLVEENKQLKKTDASSKKRSTEVKNAIEANFSGDPKHVLNCVLWITEGESAAKYVKQRISELPGKKDFNGVYGLRGKFINVRKASTNDLLKNKEYNDIKSLLNLKEKDTFKDDKEIQSKLKYGKIMLATDADTDGIHIRMLVLNLFSYKWPSLLQLGKIAFISTPAERIIQRSNGKTIKRFYSDTLYNKWAEDKKNSNFLNLNKYQVKHYKGLATSSNKDIKEDIITAPLVTIVYDSSLEDNVNLAFGKGMEDSRKDWIKDWKENLDKENENFDFYLEDISEKAEDDYKSKKITNLNEFLETKLSLEKEGSDIINNDLVEFSSYSLQRAIPSVYDGLKRSQRQILYFCLNHWNYGLTNKESEKVNGLAGLVTKNMNYAHGQVSLEETIINMANNYPGSNNINMLYPDGQFGTRENDENAASRYISTKLSEYVPYIFKKELTDIIPQRIVEGKKVEPEWIPCDIPLHLINGANGIATGWSTFIPNFSPKQIIEWYIKFLEGEISKTSFDPFYKGFEGDIEFNKKDNNVFIKGKYKILKENGNKTLDIEIFDIPVGTYIEDYSKYLDKLIENKRLKNYRDISTPNIGKFILLSFVKKGNEDITSRDNLNLVKTISLNNMNLIDESGIPSKFNDIKDIMTIHIDKMLDVYSKYKENTLNSFLSQIKYLSEKMKLIVSIIEDKLIINKRPIKEIEDNCKKQKLDFDIFKTLKATEMTKEEIEKLKHQIKEFETSFEKLNNTSHENLYKNRLKKFYENFF